MKAWQTILIILLTAAICLFSCKTMTECVPIEIKTTETITIRDTTIQKELVPFQDSIAVKDTASYLSNLYAYSWARWNSGVLEHSLKIWPGVFLVVEVPKYVEVIRNREVPKIVEVEKKLDRWEQTKVNYGGYAMVILLILLVVIFGGIIYRIRKGGIILFSPFSGPRSRRKPLSLFKFEFFI